MSHSLTTHLLSSYVNSTLLTLMGLFVVGNGDSEVARLDLGLIKREIVRMKEFGEISKNPSEADRLIKELSEIYRLDEIDQEEGF